jgi:hypothetical protein
MNYLRTTMLASLLVFRLEAGPSDYEVLLSRPSGDIFVEVWLHKSAGTNYSLSDPIRYDFRSVTNLNCKIELPKETYLCSAQMFDSSGNSVPLSTKHRDCGRRFYELEYPSAEQPWSGALTNVLRMKPARITGPSGASLGIGEQMQSDFVMAQQDAGEQRPLAGVEDLFDVKSAGVYKVRLQFQVYMRIYKGGQSFAYQLERFEPLEFIITKNGKQ